MKLNLFLGFLLTLALAVTFAEAEDVDRDAVVGIFKALHISDGMIAKLQSGPAKIPKPASRAALDDLAEALHANADDKAKIPALAAKLGIA